MPIYEITGGPEPRLVKADNVSQAVRRAASHLSAKPVTAERAVELGSKGVRIEHANDDEGAPL